MSSRLADPARSRIVLIGTPAYRHTVEGLPDVPAVANNITDLAAVFTDPELGGFDPDHCVATPAGIGLDTLGEVLTEAASQAEDLLLIYYAGHGLLGRRFQLHLALAETHPDRLGFTALPYATLREVCLDSGAKVKVVILDSCFSGLAVGQTLTGENQQILGQLIVDGTYILTSAPAHETALVLPGERHTAFTGRLLKLLQEGDPESGPVLTIGEIYQQLWSCLQAENLPQPQRLGTANADRLGLVRNRRVRLPVVAGHDNPAGSGGTYMIHPAVTPLSTVNPEPAVVMPASPTSKAPTHATGAKTELVAAGAPQPQTEHSTPTAPPPNRHSPHSSPRRRKNGKTGAKAVLGTAVPVLEEGTVAQPEGGDTSPPTRKARPAGTKADDARPRQRFQSRRAIYVAVLSVIVATVSVTLIAHADPSIVGVGARRHAGGSSTGGSATGPAMVISHGRTPSPSSTASHSLTASPSSVASSTAVPTHNASAVTGTNTAAAPAATGSGCGPVPCRTGDDTTLWMVETGSPYPGTCMISADIPGDGGEQTGPDSCTASDAQFRLYHGSVANTVQFESVTYPGTCMNSGTYLRACDANDPDQWFLIPSSGAEGQIHPYNSGECLTVQGNRGIIYFTTCGPVAQTWQNWQILTW